MHWNLPWDRKPSTKELAQINKGLLYFLHGYLYLRFTPEYINFLDKTKKRLRKFKSGLPHSIDHSASRWISRTHHSKVLTSAQAQDLVTLKKEIHLTQLEQVLPFDRAKSIILKNPESIAVTDCPCRELAENPCQPLNVCLIVGEPLASFVLEHGIRNSRKISQDEAAFILEREKRRGRIHTAWFKDALGDRFYAICNCCRCCCVGMKAFLDYQVKVVVASGYVAEAEETGCNGCGLCVEVCPFEVITLDKVARVNREKCMGCGICVDKCPLEVISFRLDPDKPRPLEVQKLTG